ASANGMGYEPCRIDATRGERELIQIYGNLGAITSATSCTAYGYRHQALDGILLRRSAISTSSTYRLRKDASRAVALSGDRAGRATRYVLHKDVVGRAG